MAYVVDANGNAKTTLNVVGVALVDKGTKELTKKP